MDLMFEEAEKRNERTYAFFKFLYYDWGEEEEDDGKKAKKPVDNAAPKAKGSKEWQIYKDVH